MAARSERRCSNARWVLTALLLAAPSGALAQDQPDTSAQAPPEAKSHFESGREHFRAGRYREAIIELKAALELDPNSPTLMYNIAYSNELLGEIEEAIVYYRKYLDALPPTAGKERDKIRLTLRRLEGHREQVEAEPAPESEAVEAAPEPAARETPAAEPAPRAQGGIGRADALFWITLGGGVAMLGGAAVTGVLALDREDAVAQFVVGDDGTLAERRKLVDEADRFALTSDLLIGGGAALVTAAALLYFLRDADDDEPDGTSDAASALLYGDGRTTVLVLRASF